MATIDWPADPWAQPSRLRWAVQAQKARWSAAYTGQAQSITHLADRWRVTIELPPCAAQHAARREAWLASLARSGDWVRLYHHIRRVPLGTLRGLPTASAAAAGATSLAVQTTAGATLLAGDMLGVAGQLVQVGYAGAVADGNGDATVPLVMPLRKAVTNGAAVTWDRPTATFQLVGSEYGSTYIAHQLADGVELQFLEVFA